MAKGKEIEVQLDFTDVTLSRTEGIYEDVVEVMEDIHLGKDNKWMIRTSATVVSPFGVGEMVLHFSWDGRVKIYDYNPSVNDVYYNPDIRALCDWAQEAGWDIPQPHSDLIRANKEFWFYFWDTLLIDSDYFDKIYGKREILGEEDD